MGITSPRILNARGRIKSASDVVSAHGIKLGSRGKGVSDAAQKGKGKSEVIPKDAAGVIEEFCLTSCGGTLSPQDSSSGINTQDSGMACTDYPEEQSNPKDMAVPSRDILIPFATEVLGL
ncbi:uncharacterized protein LOC113328661 [Papaver somniferum]|uniref:uncharacterized protein LOC113328661 n=1 Tax=Papaver somniferum TaxID=3469 RepID=UPI000E6F991A|nr:uncharacterized protein LOC113328661 [Papaver somniferum]